jgi:integration host factor subunit beta
LAAEVTKSELAAAVAEKAGLPLFAAETVVDEIFDSIIAAFQRDEGVYIRRFGSLVIRHYRSYTGRNPKTGAIVHVRRKRLPIFLVSDEMRRRMNKISEPAARIVHSGPGVPRKSTSITGVWDSVEDDQPSEVIREASPVRGK